jgi:hypothetical protein
MTNTLVYSVLLAIPGPGNHGEEVFLNVSVAVILVVVVLAIVVAVVRRRRQRGQGSWWQGPYADKEDPEILRHGDQSGSGSL